MKTVMVTGASGMIGKAVCEALLDKGHKVIGTDSTANSLSNPNFTFIQAAIDDKSTITSNLRGVDVLVHLACTVDNDYPAVLSAGEEKQCANTDKYLYKAAVDSGVGDIILISTHMVYDKQKTREPIRESSDEHPVTVYGKMKAESEKALSKVISKSVSAKAVIARVCPIYTKDYVENLKAKIYDPKDGCSFIYGYGDYGYSFCCLYNLVDFINCIVNIGQGINYQGVYNVCDSKPIAAKDIVEFLRESHRLGAVVQRNMGSETLKSINPFANKGKNDYRFNDLSFACSNVSYDNTKAQRISSFRWKLSNTK